ncbi:MAG: stage II sporulation protein D [Clostridia bacterium]
MKKILISSSLLFAIIVLVPFIFVLCTKNDMQFLQVSTFNTAKDEQIVKVLKNDTIINVPLNEFIVGALAGEISPTAPKEAIKAQAVSIYTLLLYRKENAGYKKAHNNADICADPSHCLLYLTKDEIYNKWGQEGYNLNYNKLVDITKSVQLESICYNDKPINSIFFAISPGKTESCLNVFGEDLPYLQSVDSAEDETSVGYLSTVKLSKDKVHEKIHELNEKINLKDTDDAFAEMEILNSGCVSNIIIGSETISGNEFRMAFSLRSNAFTVKSDKKNYTFSIKGYGHNVGLSQAGAIKMAESGATYKEILSHYYKDTEIKQKDL